MADPGGQNVNIVDTSNIFTGATYLLGLAAPATPATFAGRLAFLNATNGKIPADGSQDDFGDPVFAVGIEWLARAVETESFGAVKALYRWSGSRPAAGG